MSHVDVGLCVILFFIVVVAMVITRGFCKVEEEARYIDGVWVDNELKYVMFIGLGLTAEAFLIPILFEVISMSSWFTTLDMILWSLVTMMIVVPLMIIIKVIFVWDYYGKNRRESTRRESEDSMWFVFYALVGEVFLYLVWVGLS